VADSNLGAGLNFGKPVRANIDNCHYRDKDIKRARNSCGKVFHYVDLNPDPISPPASDPAQQASAQAETNTDESGETSDYHYRL
jgi:hypothetical protein